MSLLEEKRPRELQQPRNRSERLLHGTRRHAGIANLSRKKAEEYRYKREKRHAEQLGDQHAQTAHAGGVEAFEQMHRSLFPWT